MSSGQGFVLLKDSDLLGGCVITILGWKNRRKTLLLDINFKSKKLYNDLSLLLDPYLFEIIDGTDEMTSLNSIFKSFSR